MRERITEKKNGNVYEMESGNKDGAKQGKKEEKRENDNNAA